MTITSPRVGQPRRKGRPDQRKTVGKHIPKKWFVKNKIFFKYKLLLKKGFFVAKKPSKRCFPRECLAFCASNQWIRPYSLQLLKIKMCADSLQCESGCKIKKKSHRKKEVNSIIFVESPNFFSHRLLTPPDTHTVCFLSQQNLCCVEDFIISRAEWNRVGPVRLATLLSSEKCE